MRFLSRFARSFVAVLVGFIVTTPARAAQRRLSPELNDKVNQLQVNPTQTASTAPVNVIIQFNKTTTLANGIQKVTAGGGQSKSHLNVINGGVFQVPASQLATLAEDPDVQYISPDRQTIKLSPDDYILDASNTNSVQQLGYTGNGVGVAVIDSGVKASHPDFSDNYGGSRVVYSESFIPGLDATDQYGHGTAVAGLVAANGNASGQWMRGIAPRANIINLRVLDGTGSGTDSAVISAIQRAIQLKTIYNIRVINLSLGRRVFESYALDPLCQAVEQAWKAGIVVVVAAGNFGRDNTMNTNGYATIAAPGNDPYVLTVGATSTHATDTRTDDTVTSYSSKGPTLLDHVIKPDLVAPGNRVVTPLAVGSTLDTAYPGNRVSPSEYGSRSYTYYYSFVSGTSMAAPIVSGSVALMLEYIPSLTPDQVKSRMMKTAEKLYPSYSTAVSSNGSFYNLQYDIFTVGAGYLDTYDAMASNDFSTGSALSPIAVRDSNGNILVQIAPNSVWANSIVWSDSIVWGNGVLLSGSSIVWGNSVVWGDSTTQGYSIVWGSSIVWGNSATTFSDAGDYDQN
jgi:serine protease AprX